MRDHRKLRAFRLADELVMDVYVATKSFPKDEMFCLTQQIRRAAISVVSNIVEGCARSSEAEYVNFLNISYASASELEYQIGLAYRLSYIANDRYPALSAKSSEVLKVLIGLIRSLKAVK